MLSNNLESFKLLFLVINLDQVGHSFVLFFLLLGNEGNLVMWLVSNINSHIVA